MNYRHTEVWPQQSYTSDKTEIIEINVSDPISQLIIDADAYNSDDTTLNGHPVRGITKIELVDGSDVLFSLSGQEAHALDFYHNKRERQAWFHYIYDNYTDYAIALNFGRYLWDPMLALLPASFTNLQLKVTMDIDAGGSNATSIRLRVTANVFDAKAITPTGFLMAKEIQDYALGASAHEYIDMPTDHPYRKLLIKAQKYGTEPNQLLQSIKISEDQDKKVIIDQEIARWMRNILAQTPPYREGILVTANTDSKSFYCTPASTVYGNVTTWDAAEGAGELAFYDGDGGRFKVISETAEYHAHCQLSGHCPHGVFEFPFGLQHEIEDWYDVTGLGSLRLDIEAASGAESTDSAQIFLQQYRKYA